MDEVLGNKRYLSVLPIDVEEKECAKEIDNLLESCYNCKTLEFDEFKHIENNIKREILDCSSEEGSHLSEGSFSDRCGSEDDQADDSSLNILLSNTKKEPGIG